jgi:signal transduction histidine kinase
MSSVRRQEVAIFALVTFALVTVLAFGWSILVRTEQNQSEWQAYNQRIHTIHSGFFQIQKQVGYGGFIQHFHQMLLTKEVDRYAPLIEQDLAGLNTTLDELRAALILQENRDRVDILRQTFDTYAERYRQAVRLLRAGQNNDAIQAALGLDDALAMEALTKMVNRANELTQAAELRAQQSQFELLNNLRLGGVVLFVLILMGGAAMLWQIHRLLAAYQLIQGHEAQLTLALERAEQASRAKTAFISRMSHELRTPLNAILGFAQLLESDEQLNTDQRDSSHEILVAGQHLLRLVNDVLDLARIEAGYQEMQCEPVPLAPVLAECQRMVQFQARQQAITLEVSVADGMKVQADRQKLKQALLNLLSNAIKYNRPGGEVRVTALEVNEQWVRLSIKDSGLGIASEHQGSVFIPFQRGDKGHNALEGTGIGLPLTLRWVEGMGGRLWLDSTVGVGTTFYLELPCVTPENFKDAGAAI